MWRFPSVPSLPGSLTAGTQTCTPGERHVSIHKPWDTRDHQQTREAGRGPKQILLKASQGTKPADTLILGFWPQKCETTISCG